MRARDHLHLVGLEKQPPSVADGQRLGFELLADLEKHGPDAKLLLERLIIALDNPATLEGFVRIVAAAAHVGAHEARRAMGEAS